MNTATRNTPNLNTLDRLARILDARFRIPGTQIRFGVDALIGLLPGVGDLISLFISGHIISVARKHGASNYVIARMMLNSGIDVIIGAIPFVGDLFDIGFKSNQRNLRLLQQHFGEGRHNGSAARVIIPVVIVLAGLLVATAWGLYKLFTWLF